ncbi:MAG: hypothetical protein P4L68_10825 [Methylovirgula sp.]|nr:hypothetical protein [Methylovirgula sp.]
MTKAREIDDELPRLHPDLFYRKMQALPYFGYGATQIDEKIKSGDVPPLVFLSDGGRAAGWFGRAIIRWQREREKRATAAK